MNTNLVWHFHPSPVAVGGFYEQFVSARGDILEGSLAQVGINIMPVFVVGLKLVGIFTFRCIDIAQKGELHGEFVHRCRYCNLLEILRRVLSEFSSHQRVKLRVSLVVDDKVCYDDVLHRRHLLAVYVAGVECYEVFPRTEIYVIAPFQARAWHEVHLAESVLVGIGSILCLSLAVVCQTDEGIVGGEPQTMEIVFHDGEDALDVPVHLVVEIIELAVFKQEQSAAV